MIPEQLARSRSGQSTRDGQRYDQESTLPSERSIKSSLKEYFESSQSMERSQVDASIQSKVATDDASMVGSRVTAQTVFAAKQDSGSKTVGVLIFFVAMIAIGLAFVGVYFYQQTPEPRNAPSPLVAKGVEATETREYVFPEVVSQNATALPAEREMTQAQALAVLEADPRTSDMTVPEGVSQPAGVVDPSINQVVAQAAPLASAQIDNAQTPLETPDADLDAISLEGTVAISPRAIEITRHSAASLAPDPKVLQAYQAYQQGDFQGAEASYREVLAKAPEHRDALLGLAAIALLQGQPESALRIYQRLLKLDPSDIVARSGLANVLGADSFLGESELKTMLAQTPEAGYLYFALGTTYARASRWPEAQMAYFEAYRHANDNPDYAYNLAVSLDHLGQRPAAHDFYRKALEMAQGRVARFDTSSALTRIQALADTAR